MCNKVEVYLYLIDMNFRLRQLCDFDGLHKDVLTKSQTFNFCPACQGKFTPDFLPNLLICGHLICDNCSGQMNECPSCPSKLKIKDKRYKKLIEAKTAPKGAWNYPPKKEQKQNTVNLCISEDNLSDLILSKPEVFYRCTGCIQPFTKEILPNLLQCGHFLCDVCVKDKKYFSKCPELGCGKAVAIRKEKYGRLLQVNQKQAKNQKLVYNFAVGTMTSSMREVLHEVPADKTLKEVFSKVKNFQSQIDFDRSGRFSEDHLNIVLGTKAINYGQKKNKTISELMLSEKNTIKLHDSSKTLTNLVTLINRERGGLA